MQKTQASLVHTLSLTSPAFDDMNAIPSKYTCDGEDINPPLEIHNVDSRAKSLVLLVEDPDAPQAVWNHWIKFNIPPDTKSIKEGIEPPGVSGAGTIGNLTYKGPCPPSGTHRYVFNLFALDTELPLPRGSARDDVEHAMTSHIIDQASLTGLYSRT